uniref:Uncharacterized protein n=1 Tax=Anguilla anguilla TaxID=7936 RepID=A0A0E9VIV3_ANGAN
MQYISLAFCDKPDFKFTIIVTVHSISCIVRFYSIWVILSQGRK